MSGVDPETGPPAPQTHIMVRLFKIIKTSKMHNRNSFTGRESVTIIHFLGRDIEVANLFDSLIYLEN